MYMLFAFIAQLFFPTHFISVVWYVEYLSEMKKMDNGSWFYTSEVAVVAGEIYHVFYTLPFSSFMNLHGLGY